jgi:hypothetical protein
LFFWRTLTNTTLKNNFPARHWQLTPIILVTQEAEMRRIKVRGQPRQTVHEILSQKIPNTKIMADGVAQVV